MSAKAPPRGGIQLADSDSLAPHRLLIGMSLALSGIIVAGAALFAVFGGWIAKPPVNAAAGGPIMLIVMLALAAFFSGTYIALLSIEVRVDKSRGVVEEHRGFLGTGTPVLSPLSAFDAVWIMPGRGLELGVLAVSLNGPLGKRVSLGDRYLDRGAALATAINSTHATGLPLYKVEDGEVLQLVAGALAPLPSGDTPWWRQPSALVLLVANLVPLGGVLFAGWAVLPLLLLFWMENMVIGLYSIARILIARSASADRSAAVQVVLNLGRLLFAIPYGVLALAHGFAVLQFFARPDGFGANVNLKNIASLVEVAGEVIIHYGLIWGVLALLCSHGFSFYVHYLKPRRYRHASAGNQMFQPKIRLVIMHVVIFVGGFAALATGSNFLSLILLVVLKIGLDLASHLREHRRKEVPDETALEWVDTPGRAAPV